MSDLEKKIREELKSDINNEQKQKLKMKLIAIVGLSFLSIFIIPSILSTFKIHGFKLPKSYNGAIYYAIETIRNKTKALCWINDRSFKKMHSNDKDPIIYYVLLKYKERFIKYLSKFLLQKDPNNKKSIDNLVLDLKYAADNPPKAPPNFACSINDDFDDDDPLSTSNILNLLNSEGKNNNELEHVEKSPYCTPLYCACKNIDLKQVQNLQKNEHEQSNDGDNIANVIEQNQQDQGENVSELYENDFYEFLNDFYTIQRDKEIIDSLIYGQNISVSTNFQNSSYENYSFDQFIHNPNEETDGEELISNAQPSMPTDLEISQGQQVQNDENENIEDAQSNDSVVNEYAIESDSWPQDYEETDINFMHFFS